MAGNGRGPARYWNAPENAVNDAMPEMTAEDIDLLKGKVPLLSHFTIEELKTLVASSRIRVYAAGEVVVRAGQDLEFLYVLLEGSITELLATVEVGHNEGDALGPGDTLGETALISRDPLLVHYQALLSSRVLCVPLTLLRNQIMANQEAAQLMAMTISQRMQKVSQSTSSVAPLKFGEKSDAPNPLSSERPERVLVLNCGSSSLKYSLFDTEDPSGHICGSVERIGTDGARLVQEGRSGRRVERSLPNAGYVEAFQAMMQALNATHDGAAHENNRVTVVGHRVVHGGEKYTGAVVIDDDVVNEIEKLSALAPLHNPVNAAGIRAARRLFAEVPHVAVFDTAFHSTLPRHAWLYGLPYEFYERRGVRRYGFHGSSHAYVLRAAGQYLNRHPGELRLISCHLGNGASICAIDHGRSVDTTMGFTPAEGLIMGTRCGDLDPGIVEFLLREEGMTAAEVSELLNHRSGLLGLSGVSADMRELEKAANDGHTRALLAIDAFCYRLRKYIGAYVAALGGLDALVFTGGIGQNSVGVRALALQGLECMGIRLDVSRNREANVEDQARRISPDDSPVAVLVIPAGEELVIAREALRALNREFLMQTSSVCPNQPIPIEVSAHHVHLTQEHVEALFGPGHQLTPSTNLSQPGHYACQEQLTLLGPKGCIGRVRVLGPTRSQTQVEIALSEQFKLGIQPPIRESGDLEGTPGCTLVGPAGSVTLQQGVICALRHIHMTPADALRYGVRDQCWVRVRVAGDRELIFGDVLVRVSPNYALAMHIDTDEANAANLRTGAQGYIDGIQND